MQERPMAEMDEPNEWRDTVRNIYDTLHFGLDNVFTDNRLAKRLIYLIEEKHPGYFVAPRKADRNLIACCRLLLELHADELDPDMAVDPEWREQVVASCRAALAKVGASDD